ncbi:hypothetical protein HYH03_010024 [Edaphochlamys debaryana]|uniref:Protein kinase domain-containing protein n=1 Tax=Edaphochlamys debaryana TaxID=47281 RepID=A0A835XXJ8_9CHLO|nr:hypothetical protein HYH03_010024 [Edaphochlamys debaryana]|eukprot:KAG2491654.1 hypothetical protein HYH03_010024 [Edaphochlamys debaryana]
MKFLWASGKSGLDEPADSPSVKSSKSFSAKLSSLLHTIAPRHRRGSAVSLASGPQSPKLGICVPVRGTSDTDLPTLAAKAGTATTRAGPSSCGTAYSLAGSPPGSPHLRVNLNLGIPPTALGAGDSRRSCGAGRDWTSEAWSYNGGADGSSSVCGGASPAGISGSGEDSALASPFALNSGWAGPHLYDPGCRLYATCSPNGRHPSRYQLNERANSSSQIPQARRDRGGADGGGGSGSGGAAANRAPLAAARRRAYCAPEVQQEVLQYDRAAAGGHVEYAVGSGPSGPGSEGGSSSNRTLSDCRPPRATPLQRLVSALRAAHLRIERSTTRRRNPDAEDPPQSPKSGRISPAPPGSPKPAAATSPNPLHRPPSQPRLPLSPTASSRMRPGSPFSSAVPPSHSTGGSSPMHSSVPSPAVSARPSQAQEPAAATAAAAMFAAAANPWAIHEAEHEGEDASVHDGGAASSAAAAAVAAPPPPAGGGAAARLQSEKMLSHESEPNLRPKGHHTAVPLLQALSQSMEPAAAEPASTLQPAAAAATPAAAAAAPAIADSSATMLLAMSPELPEGMRRPQWRLEDYNISKRLYKGATSAVYRATCLRSNTPVALKVYFLRRVPSSVLHMMQREIEIHAAAQHPNIITLYGAFVSDHHLVLVMEYAARGDLYGITQELEHRLDERRVAKVVLRPLLSALAYLHAKGICHRDIKPENVLFTSDWTLKVADLGVSIDLAKERAVTRTGTAGYMAPEVCRCPLKAAPEDNKQDRSLAYGSACDVWALGVLSYELLVGFTPLPDPLSLPKEMEGCSHSAPARRVLLFPGGCSEEARDFIRSCLADSPDERPTTRQLAVHPWLMAALGRRAARPAAQP